MELEVLKTLERFGLTNYEARVYVALIKRNGATAGEISESSKVPRTRIYDVLKSLIGKEFVDPEKSRPTRFYARPIEETLIRLKRQFNDDIDTALEELMALQETAEREQVSMFVLRSEKSLISCVKRCIEEADQNISLTLSSLEALISLSDLLLKMTEAPKRVKVNVNVYIDDDGLRRESEHFEKLKILLNKLDIKLLPAPYPFDSILVDYKTSIIFFHPEKFGFLVNMPSSTKELFETYERTFRERLIDLRKSETLRIK